MTCETTQKNDKDHETLLAAVDDRLFEHLVKRGGSWSLNSAAEEGRAALARLHSESAKVPGLEAWRESMLHALSRGLDYEPTPEEGPVRLAGVITDAEAAEQRAVDAEAERDAARQERDEAQRDLVSVLNERDALRDRVAALEADAKKQEAHGEYRAQRRDAEKTRADSAEACVRELTEKLDAAEMKLALLSSTAPRKVPGFQPTPAPAQRCPTHPEDGPCEPVPDEPGRCVYGDHPMPAPVQASECDCHLKNIACIHVAMRIRERQRAQAETAPAQGVDEDVATVHGALDLLEHDDVGQQTEGFAALGRIEARLATPTQPALMVPEDVRTALAGYLYEAQYLHGPVRELLAPGGRGRLTLATLRQVADLLGVKPEVSR